MSQDSEGILTSTTVSSSTFTSSPRNTEGQVPYGATCSRNWASETSLQLAKDLNVSLIVMEATGGIVDASRFAV